MCSSLLFLNGALDPWLLLPSAMRYLAAHSQSVPMQKTYWAEEEKEEAAAQWSENNLASRDRCGK